MVATVSSKAATFPEDWNQGIEQGVTYFSDPMHFPFPITPLTSSTMAPAFTIGFTTAARELKSATREVKFLMRNYYGFTHFDIIPSESDEEARRVQEINEATVRGEMPRMMERWHQEHLPAIKRHLERLQGMDVRNATVAELRSLMSQAEAIHETLWTIHFRIVEPMVLAMQVYDEFFADVFGGSDADAHTLVAGGLSESIKAGIGLSDLASTTLVDRAVCETVGVVRCLGA